MVLWINTSGTHSASWQCEELNINGHAAASCISSKMSLATSEMTLVLLYMIHTYILADSTQHLATVFKTIWNFSIVSIKSLAKHQGRGLLKKIQVKPWYTHAHKKTILRLCKQIPQILELQIWPSYEGSCAYMCMYCITMYMCIKIL